MILDELPYRSLPNDLIQLFINLETLEKEKEILDQIIGSDRYDSRIRPAGMLNDTSKSKNCILSLFFAPTSRKAVFTISDTFF